MIKLLLALALTSQIPNPGSDSRTLSETERLSMFFVPEIRTLTNGVGCNVVTGTVSAASGVLLPTATQGAAGVVGNIVWSTGDTVLTMSTTTSPALAPLPYPARVNVSIFDQGANSTPTCTGGIEIIGTTMRNQVVSERITTSLAEAGTGVFSAYVYKNLSRVRLFGCANFNASDEVSVRVGPWVGIPTTRLETGDLEAFIVQNNANPVRTVRPAGVSFVNTPTGPAVNVLSAVVGPGAACIPDASAVAFRFRSR